MINRSTRFNTTIAEAINILQSAKVQLLGAPLNKWKAEGRGYYSQQ